MRMWKKNLEKLQCGILVGMQYIVVKKYDIPHLHDVCYLSKYLFICKWGAAASRVVTFFFF